ncbi:MAG: carboxypeptidase regulatory-like domain-containing protein [Isosphaeraceae bacterium]
MGNTAWRLAAWIVVVSCVGAVRGESLRGTVLGEDGSPAAGTRVWAAKLWTQKLERVETRTDDQGKFAFELAPGQWLIEANRESLGLNGPEYVQLTDGKTPAALSLQLASQGRLRVRMLEAESGRPVAGGKLVIDNGLDPVTDADGRFELPAVSKRRYHEAFVVAPGRERKRILFEMSEGPVTDLELRLPRGARAVGRVLDLEGKPIAGAFVGRSTSGSILSLTGLWVQSDAQGHFEYDGLPLERTTWMNAAAVGYQDSQRDGVRGNDGEPLPVEFRLAVNPVARARAGAGAGTPAQAKNATARSVDRRDVRGVVLGPGEKPVAGATVRWGLNRSGDAIEARTDAEGQYRLELVPDTAGSLAVIPSRDDLAPASAQVPAGGEQTVRVTLEPGHAARGYVRDDRGEPFAGVMVLPIVGGEGPGMNGLALWERQTRTDAKGRFEVKGLPATGVLFTFLGDGVSDLRNHPVELDRETVVVMSAAGAIRGKVVDAEGKPVRNFRVLLNASRERKPDDKFGGFFAGFCGIGLSYTSDDGSFLIRNLGAGTVQRVTILAPSHGEKSIDRVVAEPLNRFTPDRALKFEVPRAHGLKVVVKSAGSSKPVPGARVTLVYDDPALDQSFSWGYHDTAWGDTVHARTDAQGVADFSPLSFGEATVLVQAPGHARRFLGWRDGSDEVNVSLKPEAAVTGELTDARTGKPLDEVVVFLSAPGVGQLNASVESGDAGRFRVGELPEGEYAFTVNRKFGPVLHAERIKLGAGQETEKKLRIDPTAPQIADGQKPRPPAVVLKVGAVAPKVEAETIQGKKFSLQELRGKFVLLDFWATWCGPCVAELPNLHSVHEAFGDHPKFVMVSLSLDDSKEVVSKFLKDRDEPWTQVFLGDWTTDPVTKAYGVEGIPSIFLIDPDGKIVARDLRGTGIKAAVAKALKGD